LPRACLQQAVGVSTYDFSAHDRLKPYLYCPRRFAVIRDEAIPGSPVVLQANSA